MAATTDSFRSSLHGFNRMDVVQFIQKTTSEHELELRRLAEERVSRTLRSGRRRSPQSSPQRPFRSRAMMRWS